MAVIRSTLIASILMIVICHVTAQPTVEHCYKISDTQERCFKAFRSTPGAVKTWHEALSWCNNQSDGYSLATIRDDKTQDELASFLVNNELTSSRVWIGAKQSLNKRWTWIDGSTEPDGNVNGEKKDNPVVVLDVTDAGVSLKSVSMSSRPKYICQFSGKQCDKFVNDSLVRLNHDCYVAFPRVNHNAGASWYHARRDCLRFGGDLARSRDVLNVTSSSWPRRHGTYFVGLQIHQYVWIDGEMVGPYNNFRDTRPQWSPVENCAVLAYKDQKNWESVNCDDFPYLFVCSTVKQLPLVATSLPATTQEPFRLPTFTLLEMIGVTVGAFVFFVLCIIITVLITRACVRGSSVKSSETSARPNDYTENRKKKKNNKTGENKSQKKNQKNTKGQNGTDDGQGYEFQNYNGHDYEDQSYQDQGYQDQGYQGYDAQDRYDYEEPADEYTGNQFYSPNDVYSNDPQFQSQSNYY